MARSLKILALEPYPALSHRLFLEGLARHSRHRWVTESLPPRTWKWRMRTAALAFADTVRRHRPDLLLASDYLNLAELAALAGPLPPTVVYFHENQLTYPLQEGERRDLHFGLTHLYSILTAQMVFFNSHYHRGSFLEALDGLLDMIPDLPTVHLRETVHRRCRVLPLGTEFAVDAAPPSFERGAQQIDSSRRDRPPVILWAHRWEYDKDPPTFVDAVDSLAREGWSFSVRILGQRFRQIPSSLAQLRERWGSRLLEEDFVDDRRRYRELVADSDITFSTARHEFFGLGTLEALSLGLYPVLPDDLAYPELLPEALRDDRRFLYRRQDGPLPALRDALRAVGEDGETARAWTGARRQILEFSARFHWSRLAPLWDKELERLVTTAQ